MPEMFCPVCRKEALVIKQPVYEGFTRIGEQLKCAVCGHLFDAPETEVVAAPAKKLPAIFSEADRSPAINIFGEGENKVICRYCQNYLVNPFKQWCGFHNKEVEATDTCNRFKAKPADSTT
jgi:ribosomal protein S27E